MTGGGGFLWRGILLKLLGGTILTLLLLRVGFLLSSLFSLSALSSL